jgi:methionyl-tRNA synthetase
MEKIYITTPLYYVNAEPHLGHTYTTVIADTLKRYYQSIGYETFLLTGTDEHGDKIAQAATANGMTPREYADRISDLFRSTWDASGIGYDHFIRTTDGYHQQYVQKVLQKIYEAGEIYFGEYGGFYCYGCERFYTEKELVDGKCPDHQIAPQFISEKNYFFRMSKYQRQLIDAIQNKPDLIRPERYRAEVLAFLREPLEDLCISRPTSRLKWGIPLPFDSNYVTYVWFDALLNYVSALDHRDGDSVQSLWPKAQHLIAKDILKPHAIYWPTMLMAVGLQLFDHLNVHGYWVMDSGKMSKSLGNVIRPLEMKARFGMDAFRYFLLREMAFGQDAKFSEEALVTRINADLANNLGNLVSRVLAMQQKYFAGIVQPLGSDWAVEDRELSAKFAQAESELKDYVAELQFHRALESVWSALDHANRYVVQTAPFTLIKDPAKQARVGEVLYHLLETVRTLARLLAPFMPDTAAELRSLLNLDGAASRAPWGEGFAAGHKVNPPKVLFPRIETDAKK